MSVIPMITIKSNLLMAIMHVLFGYSYSWT